MALEQVTPISKLEQISILEACKKNFDEDHNGVCEVIAVEITKRGIRPSGTRYSHLYVPLLTRENALQFHAETKNSKVVKPYVGDTTYWWKCSEKTTRLYFINWMIRQLKKG